MTLGASDAGHLQAIMNPMRELAWHERHFVALVVLGIPSFVIGRILGFSGCEIGGQQADLAAVLMRGGYCAVFPVILACLAPRSWPLPSLMYAFGFAIGVKSALSLAAGAGMLLELGLAPLYAIAGERLPPLSQAPSCPDLPWSIGIALWLAGLMSILRRNIRFAAFIRRLEIRDD